MKTRSKIAFLIITLLLSAFTACEVTEPETGLSAPGAPVILAGDKQLSLSWSEVDGAASYQVWYSTTDNNSDPEPLRSGGDISGTSHTITGLINGTVYYVWLRARNSEETSAFSTGANGKPGVFVPTVITIDIKADRRMREMFLEGTSLLAQGNITSQGASPVISRGICWSTNTNPTIDDNHLTAQTPTGTGYFSITLTGLTESTLYYIRAYAVNNEGTAYGNQVSINSGRVHGSMYKGGLVFYNDGYGSGLAAAPSDQSARVKWDNGTSTTTGATGASTGTGISNTVKILGAQGSGSYAATVCQGTINGYSDWYLPSKDELMLMYLNLSFLGFADAYYWSSTEYSNYSAWTLTFNAEHYETYSPKGANCRVRAVRTFHDYD